MSQSVRAHLNVEIQAYDATIRRFIPGYETMVASAVGAVAARRPERVLDLGAGTGALAQALLLADERVVVELWDLDEAILGVARDRLAVHGGRVGFATSSFHDPFPPCGAMMASLSLHHIPTLAAKAALYQRAYDSLAPGGVLAIADVTIPSEPRHRDRTYRHWADHLVANGFDEARAWALFEEWAGEDTYFSLEEELGALRGAGFSAKWIWQDGPSTVYLGQRP